MAQILGSKGQHGSGTRVLQNNMAQVLGSRGQHGSGTGL